MKRTIVLGSSLSLLLLGACGSDPPPPAQTPPPSTATTPPAPPPTQTAETAPPAPPKKSLAELQQAAGKTIAEAYATGDADKYATIFAENAVVKMIGMPDITGRDAIKQSMTRWTSAFTKAKMGESRVFVKGEVVVSEWVLTATHSGDLMGFKATEKPVGLQGASVMWFTPDGLIKEEHVYHNLSTVLSQTGISKDKGRAVAALPGAPEVHMSKDTPEEKANIEVIEKMNKSWEAKKADDVTALFNDDSTWDDLTMLTPWKGKKDIKKYVSTLITAVPDAKLATTNAWGFGDYVVEEGTFAGTHKGAMFGMNPTNKSFTIHEITIAKITADKKIASASTYGNDLELIAQIDPKSIPKPPAAKDGAPAASKPGEPKPPATPPAKK